MWSEALLGSDNPPSEQEAELVQNLSDALQDTGDAQVHDVLKRAIEPLPLPSRLAARHLRMVLD